MNLNRKTYTTELNGTPITLEVSDLVKKANAAVLGKYGETVVLATAVMGEKEKDGDFFPLTVDYEERFYAVGKILGSRFIRREGRPSDEAILSGRIIDRTVRPLFDQRLRRDVQVVVTVLAYDGKNDPDVIALLAVSTALSISNIPWNGPVGGIKTTTENYQAFFAGVEERINMIEFAGKEVNEKEAMEIFETSQKEIKNLIYFQKKIIKELGKPKLEINFYNNPQTEKEVKDFIKNELPSAVKTGATSGLKTELMEHLKAMNVSAQDLKLADFVYEEAVNNYVHSQALEYEERPDGRKLDEVRELYSEVQMFERTHGSGLFVRGDTQVLAVTTLGSPSQAQLVETMRTDEHKRFMLHYNFPGFSTGELSKRGGTGRREIGHGNLAWKALNAMIPPKEKFPYTIRIVAETLSSNGSSSMATTCAGSLSLMDAGVPIEKNVAGIAMGLMLDENGKKFKVLTDIQGPEDHHGDMDCKIAGTDKGVNAIQMDVKVLGITQEIFEKTLEQAKKARLEILEIMNKVLSKSREKVSKYAPTILILNINPEKIGMVIGPGGKTINGLIAEYNNQVSIDIEQTGQVFISSVDASIAQKVLSTIESITKEFKVGDIVEGIIIKILDFGAIVDLGGGRDGMIHVSELKEGFVKKVEEVVKMGDFVRAKVIRAEEGKIGLTLKGMK